MEVQRNLITAKLSVPVKANTPSKIFFFYLIATSSFGRLSPNSTLNSCHHATISNILSSFIWTSYPSFSALSRILQIRGRSPNILASYHNRHQARKHNTTYLLVSSIAILFQVFRKVLCNVSDER